MLMKCIGDLATDDEAISRLEAAVIILAFAVVTALLAYFLARADVFAA